jgi:ABC-type branched-subunit amino acid transport system ATPase component
MPLLTLQALTKRFYGIAAVDRVDLTVEKGEIVGLIGPNGSGKTTLFNCITGHLQCNEGHVRKGGTEITHWRPDQVAMVGVARTFQTVRVFPELTAMQNLLVAAQQHQNDSLLKRFLRTRTTRENEVEARRRAIQALEFVGLDAKADFPAGELSYGQRKLLSFATTFVFDPDLILLDEPAAAVNPTMINRMRDQIRTLNERGITFLIVEHNMEFIMGLAQRIVVLDQGRKIAEGDPASVQANELVLEAYFGR